MYRQNYFSYKIYVIKKRRFIFLNLRFLWKVLAYISISWYNTYSPSLLHFNAQNRIENITFFYNNIKLSCKAIAKFFNKVYNYNYRQYILQEEC